MLIEGGLLQRLEFQRDLGRATDLWDRWWIEVNAGGKGLAVPSYLSPLTPLC